MSLVTLAGTRVVVNSRGLVAARAVVRSPFSGQLQAQDWGGRWWRYELQIGPFRAADAKSTMALLTALQGGAFLFADPTAKTTTSLGTPLVNGGSQSGSTLTTDGWTSGVTIPAGTFFSVGSDAGTRFHMVTADVTADGSGNADLAIAPALRESPANDAALEYQTPLVQLRAPDTVPASVASGAYYTFTLTAEENL